MTDHDDKPNEDDILHIISNPVYAGMGAFTKHVDDETWIRAAIKECERVGAENFMRSLLENLRRSLDALEAERAHAAQQQREQAEQKQREREQVEQQQSPE